MQKPKPERSLASYKAELKEEHDWRMRLHEQVRELTQKNESLNRRRVFVAARLIRERLECHARIAAIDERLSELDFEPNESVLRFFGWGKNGAGK